MPQEKGRSIKKQTQNPIVCGRFCLDVEARRLTKDGRGTRLTPKMTQLLVTLMINRGKTLTREFLMKEVWDTDFLGDTRTLDVHIHWVRQKVEDDPRHPVYIRTEKRVGYRFVADDELTGEDEEG